MPPMHNQPLIRYKDRDIYTWDTRVIDSIFLRICAGALVLGLFAAFVVASR